MSPGPSRPDHGAILRATYVWAVTTSMAALVPLLPLALAGPIGLLTIPRSPARIGDILTRLLISGLAWLVLHGVLRSAILATLAVRRSRGYPDRHRWFVGRAFRSIFRTGLVLLAVGAGATALAILGRGRPAEWALPVSLIALVAFFLVQIGSVLGMNGVLRHASVIPYFPEKVGEIDTFANGEHLARHVAELDEIAASLGLRTLSSFGWNDDLEGEPLAWHDPAEGHRTIDALLAHLGRAKPAWDDRDGVVADLEGIAQALGRAGSRGIPFSLLLRHQTATNAAEWEARKGTCF